MHTLLSLHLDTDDTPTAHHTGHDRTVTIYPAGDPGGRGELHFADAATARMWLEQAADAITDAERAAEQARMDRLDARHDLIDCEQGEGRDPRQGVTAADLGLTGGAA